MTAKFTHTQLVTLAVFLLGGKDRFIDTEDVAMKCHELAPGRFSWRKYPEQVNLEGVKKRLFEVTRPPEGPAMLRGTQSKGWVLTPAGLQWATEAARDPDNVLPAEPAILGRGGSVDAQRSSRELSRIKGCSAWAKWLRHPAEISKQDAAEVFRLDSYATTDLRLLKIERVRKMFIEDLEVQKFIDHLEQCLKD